MEYSIPAIIGMTLTSLYNIIDSIFIGHGVGALAISGLAITFPLMNLLVAFCTLVGVGGATLSSIRLGQKDKKLRRTGIYLSGTDSLFLRSQRSYPAVCPRFYAGNIVGQSDFLRDDWA